MKCIDGVIAHNAIRGFGVSAHESWRTNAFQYDLQLISVPGCCPANVKVIVIIFKCIAYVDTMRNIGSKCI